MKSYGVLANWFFVNSFFSLVLQFDLKWNSFFLLLLFVYFSLLICIFRSSSVVDQLEMVKVFCYARQCKLSFHDCFFFKLFVSLVVGCVANMRTFDNNSPICNWIEKIDFPSLWWFFFGVSTNLIEIFFRFIYLDHYLERLIKIENLWMGIYIKTNEINEWEKNAMEIIWKLI